jgi:hypothetical protein
MNGFEITMLSTIFYLGGVLSGLGFCFKYKKHLLLKTSSQDQLSELLTTIHSEIGYTTNNGPPIAVASAPPPNDMKEVVIRTG